MYLTMKQFVDAVGSDKLSVLCGQKILAQTPLRGGQAAEGAEAWQEVDYGEMLFIAGVGMAQPEEELLQIAQKLKEKEAVLVIRQSSYLPEVPQSTVNYCEEKGMILLVLAEHVKIQSIMRKMYALVFEEEDQHASMDKLIRQLIAGTYDTEDAQNAYRQGFEAGQEHVAVILMIDEVFTVIEKRGKDVYQQLQKKVLNKAEQFLDLRKRSTHLSIVDNNEIILFIKNEGTWLDRDFLQKFYARLNDWLEEQELGITVSAGIGSPFTQLSGMRRSVIEARRSLQMVHACKRTGAIRSYDDIGIYRLLFELQDQEVFENIRNGIIGRLREYDMVNHENMVETLRIYLENDRNIANSAAQMFLHRNTLKYRLKKIEEILLCDLSDVNVCFNLRLAFKIERFLQSEKTYYQ